MNIINLKGYITRELFASKETVLMKNTKKRKQIRRIEYYKLIEPCKRKR